MTVEKNKVCSWPFNEQLRLQIHDNLQGFKAREHDKEGMRQAAVALTLVGVGSESLVYTIASAEPHEAALVLTRRSEQLANHAGQWALPGGSLDPGETAVQAALREMNEEIGLKLPHEALLGQLDDFTTRSGFTITPLVFWAGQDPQLVPNPAEVASIHRIPLREFMRQDAPVLQSIPESSDPVLLMPVGNGWIASPTGAIIYQFREVALKGKMIRVDHYEQPYFAWQ